MRYRLNGTENDERLWDASSYGILPHEMMCTYLVVDQRGNHEG